MPERKLPYGKQWIDDEDIRAVVDVLSGDWLTTGPRVEDFESSFAACVRARHAVAVSSGTAALHCAMHAAGIGPGDEVLVPAMTFVATANAVLYCGATPVFVDVEPDTLLIDANDAAAKVSSRSKAIVAVDYAGQPCDYDVLRNIARRCSLVLIADACHALGAQHRGDPVGSIADLSAFSFHPVKHVTTGEGGMITTSNAEWAARMRAFRNHGITTDHRQRETAGSWSYEMVELGFNYRLTDMQCALGKSQLRRLPEWLDRRHEIAAQYRQGFADTAQVRPLAVRADVRHAHHLFVIRVAQRARLFAALRNAGIGVNVHYAPVYMHPYYRRRLGLAPGLCPVAEAASGQILSLPMFPRMTDDDVAFVVGTFRKLLEAAC